MSTLGSENQRCLNNIFRCLDALVILKSSHNDVEFLALYESFKNAKTLEELTLAGDKLQIHATILENKNN